MKLHQLKIIIYILLGVLPASFWVLFAPIVILKSVTFADMLGGIGMILGTVGIYLATFIRKPKSSTTIILTIVLLFIGQAIMVVVLQDPFILRKFPNSKFDYMMALGTLGPILIAVHYQCYAIRQLNKYVLQNLLIVAVVVTSLGGHYILNLQGSEKARLVDSYNVTCNNRSGERDQPSDYYFYPNERFSGQPHLINLKRRGTIKPHRFSTESTYYSIRPIHAQLVIPRNLLHSFHRRCIGKQYRDLVLIETLWPNMGGRTIDNEPFSGEKKSSDAIFLTIGNIHSETDQFSFRRKINRGELIKVSENKDSGLTEYKNSKNIETATSTYLVDKSILTTYLGNEIIFACHRPAVHGNPKKGRECTTKFVLPDYIWPKDHYGQRHLRKNSGLAIQYRFHRSHIEKWQEIHNSILIMLKGALVDANFDDIPNK